MKRSAIGIAALVLAMSAGGCGEKREEKEPIPMSQLPAAVVKAAQKRLPDVAFDGASKGKVGKVDAYELKGKDKTGKARQVEITREGKILDTK